MKQIGRKIYYDKATGEVIQTISERQGFVNETTQEQDFQTYKALAERVPDTVGCIQLAYGEMAEDFAMAESCRVDTATNQLIFTYRDPGNPTEPIERPSYEDRISALENAMLVNLGL